ncbi:MAG: DUF5069 domain-containing protein [Vampirovibrionales bacterium]|nr:DUF5069 domain-containing protein [Vampirovibrionales bacterium]
MPQTQIKAPDLSKAYPRSANESLGFYVLLPRIIDKCRATIAQTNGEYKFNCPLDRQFFDWTGVDAEAFRKALEAGQSDEDILHFVKRTAKPHTDEEIRAWSYQQRWRRPDAESQAKFETMRQELAPDNYRVETWFQLLDADEKRF